MSEVAAPPAPPPPSPANTPAGQPSNAPNDPFNNAFADLDQITKEPEDAPEPPSEKLDKVEKNAKESADKKTDEPPPKSDKTETEFDAKKAAPKQLREAYEKTKAELAQIRAERDEIKKSASQPREDPEKKDYLERAERHARKAQELENELKFAKYEKSQEYLEKYYQPYERAFGAGRSKAAAIKVSDSEGNLRAGTPEDFDTYMGIGDEESAADFAEKVFGKHKTAMEYHREEVRKLGSATQHAIEDFRKKGAEREKEWQENQNRATKAAAETWSHLNKAALDKYPALFKAGPEDTRGAGLLEKGFDIYDRAFTNGAPIKEDQKPLNGLELMQIRSAMRNKAAAFDYQVYLKQQALAEVKKLKASLEAYNNSEPRGGNVRQDKSTAEGWEAELAGLAAD